MRNEFLSLSAELKELELILSEIPKENVIERISFESRITSVRNQLNELDLLGKQPEKARLTFRGKPVLGSYGICADFASKAAGAFTDAFAAVTAGLNESLRYMGPIPDKAQNTLFITGTAVGSFGFEFDLPIRNPELFPTEDKAELAFEKIQSLFHLTAEGTDDDIAELVDEIHPRAVKKVAEFLGYLVQQQAWCGLEFKEHFFKYSDIDQLKYSLERIQEENIKETRESYRGIFQGVLPKGRSFEFLVTDQEEVIKGKIDISIETPADINREYLEKTVDVIFSVIQVGQGRPKYTLLSLDDIVLVG